MDDVNPTIFLSYSLTKAPDAETVKKLLLEIRSALTTSEWKVSDPLESTSNENEGIRERVASHIYASDAVFAECSMAVPNVMFEVGFARAVRYPLVLFVNRDVYSTAPEQIQAHLRFMGLNRDRPVPTDLGDIEYFEYSDNIRTEIGAEQFRIALTRLMGRLESGSLSEGARLLRRNSISFQKENVDLLKHYRNDHPFFRLLAGWNQKLLEDLRQRGRLVFEIDSSYYQSVLSTFQSMSDRSVRAIADLTDATEAFWSSSPDPLKTSVSERIFVVGWNVFFDPKRLTSLCRFLCSQAKEYSVRLILSSTVESLENPHQFGEAGVGYHLLLMGPDLVGGYVKRNQQRLLHIESNPGLHATASNFYSEVQQRSFEIDASWGVEQVRRAWMQKDGVGLWNPGWHEVESRSDDYFRNYDKHIRFWIPFYDDLIRHTAAIVQGEIAHLMRNENRPIETLEIGFGTGNLTRSLVQWIRNLNQPFHVMGQDLPIARYWGIDRALPMVDLLKAESRDWRNLVCTFLHGVALEGLDLLLEESSFSVIFGSLVLHDLFTFPSPPLADVFRGFRKFLTPNGSLIFADAFFSETNKENQLLSWRRGMAGNGLAPAEIDAFLNSNPEMVDALPIDKVRTEAAEAGFTFFDPGPLPSPGKNWPFRVLILRMRPEQSPRVQQWPRRPLALPQ